MQTYCVSIENFSCIVTQMVVGFRGTKKKYLVLMFRDVNVLADYLASPCQGLYALLAFRNDISGCAQVRV